MLNYNEHITPEMFNKELASIQKELSERLSRKAEEYATDDRYHNFVEAGAELATVGLNVEDETLFAIFALATKHLISVKDILNDIQTVRTPDWFKAEFIDEKFGDLINYLLLMHIYVKYHYSDYKQGKS